MLCLCWYYLSLNLLLNSVSFHPHKLVNDFKESEDEHEPNDGPSDDDSHVSESSLGEKTHGNDFVKEHHEEVAKDKSVSQVNDWKCEHWVVVNVGEVNKKMGKWDTHSNDTLSNSSHLSNDQNPDHCESEEIETKDVDRCSPSIPPHTSTKFLHPKLPVMFLESLRKNRHNTHYRKQGNQNQISSTCNSRGELKTSHFGFFIYPNINCLWSYQG